MYTCTEWSGVTTIDEAALLVQLAGMTLTAEHVAQLIVESIDRHGLRGLIYEADGMTDVVMHGKVDMLAVARDVISAMTKD